MSWSQITLLVLMGLGFLKSVREEFEGRPAKEPHGFVGFIGTVIAFVVVGWLYWHSWFWSGK